MNRILAAFLFLMLSVSLQAQFSVGVRQGYGNHGVYFVPIFENQVDFWLPSTALVVSYTNQLNTGLQTEFAWAQKGWREAYDSVPDSYFYRKITYLEIPFFGHFEIGKGKVRPVIQAGPYIAFKLSETSDSLNYEYPTTYNHHSQTIRNLDYGIKIGVGLRYNINKHLAVFGEARYDLQMAGGRDIYIDRPNGIDVSRLTEMSGTIGILWHIIPQKQAEEKQGYTPKEDLF